MSEEVQTVRGTILWIAPFYNRSGYGTSARSFVSCLHRAGVRIRIMPGTEFEPGIDDCDLDLLRSLESTPLVPPITAIVSHLPHRTWLDLKLPEPNIRIMATTFDSSAQGNLPPAEWIEVCREMDQIWLMTEKERDLFISIGFPPDKIKVVLVPHSWLGNPVIPPATLESWLDPNSFTFLSIAMFQPRRRWHTLVEAFLEEFRENENVELYLKANYPTWHPVPGKPRQDLHGLVGSLRLKTGSRAKVTIDDDLGTRLGIVRLIDSSNVYISTDTAFTGPVAEAFVRLRLAVIPEGLGLDLPKEYYVGIPTDPHAKCPMTREMLLYQPHHKDAFMPELHVKDVRYAMRRAYNMSPGERHWRTVAAQTHVFSPERAVPATISAINSAWRYRASQRVGKAAAPAGKIVWEGTQLVSHSLALINRELCLGLIDSGYEVSIIPGGEVDDINPDADPRFEKIVQRTRKPLSGKADVYVRHHWPPNFDPPKEGHWVIIQPWEYGRLPESWVEPMASLVDEMWVPSRHVQKTYIASGVPADRVQVVPNGVDAARFHPSARKHRINSEKKFKFLFVGAAIWRKGIDILLDAYRSTFDSRDDVAMIIKDLPAQVFYQDQGAGRIIREMQKDPKAPEIVHLEVALKPRELPGIYTACDCLVHPYRAEGFAMPVLEAMACGIPVITTAGGSTDDFCSPDSTYLIPAGRAEFSPTDIKLAGGGGWVLRPDSNALCALMREVFENYGAAKERALRVSEHVRSQYDWKIIADKVMARIDVLTQKPIKRMAGV